MPRAGVTLTSVNVSERRLKLRHPRWPVMRFDDATKFEIGHVGARRIELRLTAALDRVVFFRNTVSPCSCVSSITALCKTLLRMLAIFDIEARPRVFSAFC